MQKFVVFDLDGTLLNTLPDIAGAMNRVLFRFGLPQHPEESFKQFTGNGARMLTLRALGGQEELVDTVYPVYLNEYARTNRLSTAPYEGVVEMLEALAQRSYGLIVYSNKDDKDAKDVVAHYLPEVQFLDVVGSLRDVPLKPDPTALNAIMHQFNLKPEDGLYLGDTIMDMQCAKATGLTPIAVLWGFQSEEELRSEQPAHFISHPLDLIALLDGQETK